MVNLNKLVLYAVAGAVALALTASEAAARGGVGGRGPSGGYRSHASHRSKATPKIKKKVSSLKKTKGLRKGAVKKKLIKGKSKKLTKTRHKEKHKKKKHKHRKHRGQGNNDNNNNGDDDDDDDNDNQGYAQNPSDCIERKKLCCGCEPDADEDAAVRQMQRYLKVTNKTRETLTVYVQYHTQVKCQWVWLPDDPSESEEAVVLKIAPGETVDIEDDNGSPVSASRVRIWAIPATTSRLKYKDVDLWLVPEKDDHGRHYYFAEERETFTYTFSPAEDK
jgi:hypothetical protein